MGLSPCLGHMLSFCSADQTGPGHAKQTSAYITAAKNIKRPVCQTTRYHFDMRNTVFQGSAWTPQTKYSSPKNTTDQIFWALKLPRTTFCSLFRTTDQIYSVLITTDQRRPPQTKCFRPWNTTDQIFWALWLPQTTFYSLFSTTDQMSQT